MSLRVLACPKRLSVGEIGQALSTLLQHVMFFIGGASQRGRYNCSRRGLDGDGLDFYEEKLSLDAFTQDVDLDGLPDGWEVLVGLTSYARDLRFSGDQLTSVSGLTSTASDIRFIASTITGTNTVFPAFLPGQQISVVGSGKNDGIYTLTSDGISPDGKTLTIDETNRGGGYATSQLPALVVRTSIYPLVLSLVKGSDSATMALLCTRFFCQCTHLVLPQTPHTFNAELLSAPLHYSTRFRLTPTRIPTDLPTLRVPRATLVGLPSMPRYWEHGYSMATTQTPLSLILMVTLWTTDGKDSMD